MADLIPAPEADEIAREVIREHHKDLNQFGVRVRCCFASETMKSKGAEVWAKIEAISGKSAFLYHFASFAARTHEGRLTTKARFDLAPDFNQPFYLITISHPVWRTLKAPQQRALIDSELMHCNVDVGDNGLKLGLVGHDFEAFRTEIERHGLWRNEAKAMAEAIGKAQESLPFEVATPDVLAVRDLIVRS